MEQVRPDLNESVRILIASLAFLAPDEVSELLHVSALSLLRPFLDRADELRVIVRCEELDDGLPILLRRLFSLVPSLRQDHLTLVALLPILLQRSEPRDDHVRVVFHWHAVVPASHIAIVDFNQARLVGRLRARCAMLLKQGEVCPIARQRSRGFTRREGDDSLRNDSDVDVYDSLTSPCSVAICTATGRLFAHVVANRPDLAIHDIHCVLAVKLGDFAAVDLKIWTAQGEDRLVHEQVEHVVAWPLEHRPTERFGFFRGLTEDLSELAR